MFESGLSSQEINERKSQNDLKQLRCMLLAREAAASGDNQQRVLAADHGSDPVPVANCDGDESLEGAGLWQRGFQLPGDVPQLE